MTDDWQEFEDDEIEDEEELADEVDIDLDDFPDYFWKYQ